MEPPGVMLRQVDDVTSGVNDDTMKIQYGAGIESIKGQIAGPNSIVAWSRGGMNIARTGFNPTQPMSEETDKTREYINRANTEFGLLSIAQRAAWESLAIAAAVDADGKFSEGALGVFQAVNFYRQVHGFSVTRVAPPAGPKASVAGLSVTRTPQGFIVISVVYDEFPNPSWVAISNSGNLGSAQRRALLNEYRLAVGVKPLSIRSSNQEVRNYDYTATAMAREPQDGDWIGVKLVPLSQFYVPGTPVTFHGNVW